MKTNFTHISPGLLIAGVFLPGLNFGQSHSGAAANVGIDGDVLSRQAQNISAPMRAIFDSFKTDVAFKADIIESYMYVLRAATINKISPSPLIIAMGVSTAPNTRNRYIDLQLFHSNNQKIINN